MMSHQADSKPKFIDADLQSNYSANSPVKDKPQFDTTRKWYPKNALPMKKIDSNNSMASMTPQENGEL